MHRVYKDIDLPMLPAVGGHSAVASGVVESVVASAPMDGLRSLLGRLGLRIESKPIVCKDLSDSLVRLMFPVSGGPVVDGAVVAIVCLFDRQNGRTLYAHPMHAGPGVNPLVRHPDGPMAGPKSQAGADGVRASRRIIEHKQALWDRFVREEATLGEVEAGRRWREGYYWSLNRLYFCAGCTECKWGSPFFDGPDSSLPRRASGAAPTITSSRLNDAHTAIVGDILSSEAWRVESGYVQRGGFTLIETPGLLKEIDDEYVQVVFPTDALLLQAGSIVAVAFTYHAPSRSVSLSHCLCAGSEVEIQFLKGDIAFGLPQPQSGQAGEDAIVAYRSWRRGAWSRFWLNELDNGLAVASDRWLGDFWGALETFFGGNDIAYGQEIVSSLRRRDSSNKRAAARGSIKLPSQALENIGGRCFAGHATNRKPTELRALGLSTLMVNLGHRCNLACSHCHVEAGPDRTEEMSRETVDLVLRACRDAEIETLDITGGAPEMNPHFRYLAREASRLGCRVIDRCNLTIIFEPGHEDLPEFLAENAIQITASLPSEHADVADRQRGMGTFAKSIAALRKFNQLGYGQPGKGLTLNLVVNPSETELGPPQDELERQFKRELRDVHGIVFDRLLVMNNMPINRFEHYLKREGRWSEYMNRLVGVFNADTTDGLMCRRTLSVGYDGRLYDCDFNQMMDIPLSHGLPAHIRDLDASLLRFRIIHTAGHCFGCSAGAGSSCNGAIATSSCHKPVNRNESGHLEFVQLHEVKR